ncbi:MAG: glycosyltransferase, partial [Thermosynechococcaceae cyanobacterium]
HIYAQRPKSLSSIHEKIKEYNLLKRTFYRNSLPRIYIFRLLKTLFLIASNINRTRFFVLIKIFKSTWFKSHDLSINLINYCIPFLHSKPSFDVVSCHFGHIGVIGVHLKEMGVFDGKIYTTFHGWDMTHLISAKGESVYNYLFEKGEYFLPVSNHWKNKLINLGCDEERIIVHHMGVDCKKFIYCPRQSQNKYKNIRIVTIARLVEKKGIEYAIQAIAIAARITRIPIRYEIVGDGPLRKYLEKIAFELGVDNIVSFVGGQPQEKIANILKDSDFMLAPSVTGYNGDQEGIPVVLMEAMASGLPIISTLHSGIPELVKDNVSGFLVPERDAQSLAEKIVYLIENPQTCHDFSLKGRKEVENYYNIDILNTILENIFINS